MLTELLSRLTEQRMPTGSLPGQSFRLSRTQEGKTKTESCTTKTIHQPTDVRLQLDQHRLLEQEMITSLSMLYVAATKKYGSKPKCVPVVTK